ncbi:Locomotion-related protein Hikaru genki [Trichinella pseudospiralis]|uniref:Locomotion-related protein Hikaru genki n=1 Tax=Trichinella pseudospiralis TaxID=6337 RepID=A0A0V1HVI2_TRIPS|nr:Locomotion-related protein Hikaru genki [Trichinella pseudospiralis]KRZ29042.1 Locomotion-related protein Hikaru genki [Trichinella pseudospiralis]
MKNEQMVLFAMFHVLLILFYNNILKPDVAATAFLITNCPIRPDNWQELFSSQRCRRSCLVDSDCKPRHDCICDQECGLSCIKQSARCPPLNNTLTNGIVQLPKESKVGSVTRYSCIGNYRLIGSASRVCQGNKQWSGEEPFCLASATLLGAISVQRGKPCTELPASSFPLALQKSPIMNALEVEPKNRDTASAQPIEKCPRPPELPFAKHNASDSQQYFDVDTELYYTCLNGYSAHETAFPKTKCLLYNGKAEWFGPDVQCTGKVPVEARSCGDPGEVMNALRFGDQFHYPHSISYRCIDGFRLHGSPVQHCLIDGTWSNAKPTCKRNITVQCPKPKAPFNGHVQGISLDFQSKIAYFCDEGYRLVGQKQRICQSDRTWSGSDPYCEEINCPTLGVLWNGFIDGEETSYGAMVIFRCLEGMTHLGAPYSRCEKDGTWSQPLPQCLAPCHIPLLTNGEILHHKTDELVPHGERITVECVNLHELEYNEQPVCNNGSWSHLIRCVPKHCPHPKSVIGDIENGIIKLEGSMGTYEYKEYIKSVGEYRSIIFECHRGYLATCVNGTWQPNVRPRCVLQTHPVVANRVNWDVIVRERRNPSFNSKRTEWQSKIFKHRAKEESKKKMHRLRAKGRLLNDKFNVNNDESKKKWKTGKTTNDQASSNVNSGKVNLQKEKFQVASRVPVRDRAFFVHINEFIKYGERITNGITVNMHCFPGYKAKGVQSSSCIRGDWSSSFGYCLPNTMNPVEQSVSACAPPTDIHRAAVFRIPPVTGGPLYEHGLYTHVLMGDTTFPQTYPNGTLVQYRCSVEKNDQYSKQSSLQAMAVQCVNGAWIALLKQCVDSGPKSSKLNRKQPIQDLQRNGYSQNLAASTLTKQNRRCNKPIVKSPWTMQKDRGKAESFTDSEDKSDNAIQKLSFKMTYQQGSIIKIRCKLNNVTSLIRCSNGHWTPPDASLCKNVSNDQPMKTTGKNSCWFYPTEFRHIIAFNNLTGEDVIFKQILPEKTVLILRCSHVGMFQLVGPAYVACNNGTWNPSQPKPYCRPIGFIASPGHPPAITYRTVNGEMALAPTGELIVRRSSSVQLNCIFPKEDGQPVWQFTSSYRNYPQQWTNVTVDTEPYFQSDDKVQPSLRKITAYRLTIYMARPEDSGTFYCVDPVGRRHAVRLILRESEGTILKTTKGNYFGSIADFQCHPGYKLQGPSRLRCLQTGEWSSKFLPKCFVQCENITKNHPALSINVSSYNYNGIAVFNCAAGYSVEGPRFIQCTAEGKWSEEPPSCQVIKCPYPDVPTGSVLVPKKTDYYYRDIVLFSCQSGYLLTGKNYAVCNQYGLWTNEPPECIRYCWFPGKPLLGDTTSEPKSYYLVGDVLVYYCTSNRYRIDGHPVLRCTSTGRWSSSVPRCRPPKTKHKQHEISE